MTRRLDEYPPGSAMSEAELIRAYGGLRPTYIEDREPEPDNEPDGRDPEGDPTLNGAFEERPIDVW